MEQIFYFTRSEWHKWLQKNHTGSAGVWFVFFKKRCGKPSLDYNDFVEEALCFGWIDSIIKRLDEERYARKVTPRRPNSVWSELNKKRVIKLEKTGLMTDAGRKMVDIAKKSGAWDKTDIPEIKAKMDPEFQNALNRNQKAKSFFEQLTPSRQMRYLHWIQMAKQAATRDRRICEAIELLTNRQTLGLK
ncbi:MAG: YdeI/OmpD-associated family protein [Candidatus Marinimicrobia bacterium]|nr:YdeI/OmpD-associated family protein [Candidatus Neomarinimicrobiota bacterium]